MVKMSFLHNLARAAVKVTFKRQNNKMNQLIVRLQQNCHIQLIFARNYAKPVAGAILKKKKVGGKLGPVVEKKILPVETDTSKLVNYVCGSNINKTGEDIKLKPESEYPEWLWTLNTGRPATLEELDPETKQYWRKLRTMALRRNNQLSKLKKF